MPGTIASRAVLREDFGSRRESPVDPVAIPVADHVKATSGHYICAQLRMYGHTGNYRSSISPGDLVRQLTNTFYYSPEAADVQIQAAQAEICPETLRP